MSDFLAAIVIEPFAFLALMALMIPLALWYSLAASILWGWFIVPFFHAPPLTTFQMFAVLLVCGAMRGKTDFYQETRKVDWSKLGFSLLAPGISIGIGAVMKFWVLGI